MAQFRTRFDGTRGERCLERFEVTLYAYVLLDNHYRAYTRRLPKGAAPTVDCDRVWGERVVSLSRSSSIDEDRDDDRNNDIQGDRP